MIMDGACHAAGACVKDHVSCLSIAGRHTRRHMELRHIRYFTAVAEDENVSRAAMKLHVSQPALSRQIRDLEDELGFPLLERSAKAVRLTAAGRVFLEESRAILQRVREAVDAARAGAYIHGLAADVAVEKRAARSLIAGDVLAALPRAFARLERGEDDKCECGDAHD